MLGRRFIGIDVCKEYLETAEKRISAAETVSLAPLAKAATQAVLFA
jgi:DNA modification methylase